MNKKLLGIFICTLLIATTIQAVGAIKNSLNSKSKVATNNSLVDVWEKTFGVGSSEKDI